MTRPLGMGVVGAGSIGIRAALQHLSISDVQDRVRLAAVCDPVPGRAKAAADKYGVPHAYDTLEELLADDTVDAVTIGSPIGVHYDQGVKAISAGKHIHFNKTMTVTAAEATDLIVRAEHAGVKIVASPGQMVRPANRHIRRLIQDGALGQMLWAATGAAFGDYHEQEGVRGGTDVLTNINPSWYWRKPGGGPLYDMTVYGLHTLTGVLGPARRVTAMSGIAVKEREFQGVTYPVDADDNSLLLLDFGGSLFAFVYGTPAGSLTEYGQPTFYGTKGSIAGLKHDGTPLEWPEKNAPGNHFNGPHVVGPHDRDESHVYEDMMQLVDWVNDGTPSVATAQHARHVIEIIEAGFRAAETGQVQLLTTTF